MLTGKMQPDHLVINPFQAILAVEYVKERPTNAHVFVQGCLRDLIGLSDVEAEAVRRLPDINRFHKHNTAAKGCVTNTTDPPTRERVGSTGFGNPMR